MEQGGITGLLRFTEPHWHAPFLITATALAFGLMGIAGMWEGVNFAWRLLAVAATVVMCLVTIQGAYAGRHQAREEYLLRQVQRASPSNKPQQTPNIRLSVQLRATLIPVAIMGFALLLIFALIQSDLLWKIARWLFLEPYDQTLPLTILPEEIQSRVRAALPLVLLTGYVSLFTTLAYASSTMLAQEYAHRMSRILPPPIFLQGDLLSRVVQKEALQHLSREPRSSNDQQASLQSRGRHTLGKHNSEQETTQKSPEWIWEELERTADGGIKLRAQPRPEQSEAAQNSKEQKLKYAESPSYMIEADRWGRIITITHGLDHL